MSSWPLHRIRIKLKFYESQYGKCFDITKIVILDCVTKLQNQMDLAAKSKRVNENG